MFFHIMGLKSHFSRLKCFYNSERNDYLLLFLDLSLFISYIMYLYCSDTEMKAWEIQLKLPSKALSLSSFSQLLFVLTWIFVCVQG